MNGVLVIDKPSGITSHDVVNRVRRILNTKSVGHLGTLDPLATGVLPLLIGNLTRLAQFYTSSEKSYEGVIRFGFATDTYDSEGDATSPVQSVMLTLGAVQELAVNFRGSIEQTPPLFSAKKIQGVPAYKLARKQKDVTLKRVNVEVKEFEILNVEGDRAAFRARVSSGTYMRSVAHDMGQQLGCGAHLVALRRTAVAEFNLAEARTFYELELAVQSGSSEQLFVHSREILPGFPSVTANDDALLKIRRGQSVNLPELSKARLVKVFEDQKELTAIAERIAGTLFHPKIVFSAERSMNVV